MKHSKGGCQQKHDIDNLIYDYGHIKLNVSLLTIDGAYIVNARG